MGFIGETFGSKTILVKGFDSQKIATLMPSVKTNIATNHKIVSTFGLKGKKFIPIRKY